jgi:hypothetical protein
MPKCKNDPTKKYKGDEPSPKGLGHCAHAEAIGTTKKGLDGRKWTVQTDKNGTKSWKPVPKHRSAPAVKKPEPNAYSPEKYAYLDNGEWFLEYYKSVKLPKAHADFLIALEKWWEDDTSKPTGFMASLFGSAKKSKALPPGAAAFASYVASKAKTLLGKIAVDTSEIHVGDPYYPKPAQAFAAANGEWTVKTWPATTAFIARAPGATDLGKLTWTALSCHGRSYQGVSDRVFDPDEVEAMELDDKVRGKHVIAEMAHEMRGRVAMLGFKGSKVVCVVYPSMLNNL